MDIRGVVINVGIEVVVVVERYVDMFIVRVGVGDFFVVFIICCILVVLKYIFGMKV